MNTTQPTPTPMPVPASTPRHASARALNMGNTTPLIYALRAELGRLVLAGCEVGVYRGETSAILLKSFPALHLYMVDPWAVYNQDDPYRRSGDGCSDQTAAEQQHNLDTAISNALFARHRCTIIRATSVEAGEQFRGPRVQGLPLDFVFIDGDHRYEAVRDDLISWWPNVRDGGVLSGHDWNHPANRKGKWGVNRAVEEFAAGVGVKVKSDGEVWWFVKPEGGQDREGG